MPYAHVGWKRKYVSIKRLRPSFTGRLEKFLSRRQLPFILGPPMLVRLSFFCCQVKNEPPSSYTDIYLHFVDRVCFFSCFPHPLVAKQYAFWILVNYREAYGMHLTNGILFNHESPRRGGTFVTRKITTSVARIKLGLEKTIFLGNIDAKRDWGHARDYVKGMWMMMQQDEPDDYVLATGETHTVREFVEKSFAVVGITIKWMGPTGTVDEIGVNALDESQVLVKIDPRYFRPTEVDLLLGDPTKAKEKIGWVAECTFDELVKEMVEADLAMVQGKVEDLSGR